MCNFDDSGLHTVGWYDENGNMVVRIDVTGRPHANVPTPHVLDYELGPRPTSPYVGFRKTLWGGTNKQMDEIIDWIASIED